MGAEHAPGHVGLVHHHQGEPQQEVAPSGVAGKDRGVQHVRVRHDQVGVAPDQGPFRLRGVAVEDGGSDLWQLQVADLPELIARQGLGGEQIEGGSLLVHQHGPSEGHVVDERLSRGRPGAHHHVPPSLEQVQGPALVRVEALDPNQRQPATEHVGEIGERFHHRIALRQPLHMGQAGPAAVRRHQPIQESLRVHLPGW